MKSVVPFVLLAAVLLPPMAQAQRSEAIEARTAGELAELCAANPKDPRGDAKINFCHGYAQGAISTVLNEGKKPFCFPSPAPSRTATLTEFVNWVRAIPEHKSMRAIDGFFRFLGERYPCK